MAMAQVKQAFSTSRAAQDATGDVATTTTSTSSFHRRRRRRHHSGHGTNRLYTHDSGSSLLLADDEGSLAGSHGEADGELRLPTFCPTILSV
jgi:hypothetical protein